MENTVLSIVIPVYNVEKFISNTLLSVLSQNRDDVEVLVIDDGSTDCTYNKVNLIVDSFEHARIKLFSKPNGGVSSARNFGILNAVGDYIIFLDGDDALKSTALENLIPILLKNAPDIVHWPFILTDENNREISKFPYTKYADGCTSGEQVIREMFKNRKTWIWTGSVAYSRSLLASYQLQFTEGCVAGEDLEFVLKALSVSKSVLFTENVVSCYTQRQSSVMNQFNIKKFDVIGAYQRVADYFMRTGKATLLEFSEYFRKVVVIDNFVRTYEESINILVKEKSTNLRSANSKIIIGLNKEYPRLIKVIRDLSLQNKRWDAFVLCTVPLLHFFWLAAKSRVRKVIS